MKAVGLTEFGGPDVLQVVDLPTPEPGPGELRIRVHAVAVNPTDVTFRAGGRVAQLADRKPPYIPGMDAAGVVDKLGPGTSGRLSAGDRVIMLVVPMGPHGGTYAEQLVASEASVVRAPKNATDAEATTLLLNAVAAHLALDALGLSTGQPVAISGAAGAVGGYAVQLAKARGLTVIADAVLESADAVLALGADHVVARGAEYADEIRQQVPGGVPGLVDGANLDAAALPGARRRGSTSEPEGLEWSGRAWHRRPSHLLVRVGDRYRAAGGAPGSCRRRHLESSGRRGHAGPARGAGSSPSGRRRRPRPHRPGLRNPAGYARPVGSRLRQVTSRN